MISGTGPASSGLQAGDVEDPERCTILEGVNLYIGPDALMPIASVFAAVAGFVMMFWRRIVGMVRHLVQRLSGPQTTGGQ